MSLIEKPVKRRGRPNKVKTEEEIALAQAKRREYQKNYQKKIRQEDPTHFRNLGKKSYYKLKYGLDTNFETNYGEYSGEIFKLQKTFSELCEKAPNLKNHIIELFTNTDFPDNKQKN